MMPVEEGSRVKMEPDGVVSSSRGSLASCRPELKPEEATADMLDIDFNCSTLIVADDDDNSENKSSASNGTTADTHFF
ncbi:hypothetical protein GUJ93_ZPchr0002g24260 [Zizania palustris]|uniref:Uncharacterized protein n=1 Tax=Zizania palustris TaxID=103762 RepID=A0A8J5RH87_ZIZPA|nr:hypothetical protein GUJ93_ZPchr0002g24260 [Zizania palustris]